MPFLIVLAACLAANPNRRGRWLYFETTNFRILYHREIEPQARAARDFLEPAYARILEALRLPPCGLRITVVLTGYVDDSNGLATPLGHRIVIYTRPEALLNAADIAWLRRVLAHELTHQVTFLSLRNAFGIYGELYQAAHLPVWFIEGIAQYAGENWDAKRNVFFAHVLANSALEPYPNLATFVKSDPVSARIVYEQGHAFVRYLADVYGSEVLGRIILRTAPLPVWSEAMGAITAPFTNRFLPFEYAVRKVTGRDLDILWRDFLRQVRPPRSPAWDGEPLVDFSGRFDAVFQARRAPGGTLYFTAQKSLHRPEIALHAQKSGEFRRLAGFVGPVFDLSPDGALLAYSQSHTDWDGSPVNKVFVREADGGRRRFVSDGGRHPAWLANDTLAFAYFQDGRAGMRLCRIADTIGCRDFFWPSFTVVYAPSRSSRGLLFTAMDTSGACGIYAWSPPDPPHGVARDSLLLEFPVEVNDSTLLVLRENENRLLQAFALHRPSGRFLPARSFPAGTFLLHRLDDSTVATSAALSGAGAWKIGLQGVRTPEPDGSPVPAEAITPSDPEKNHRPRPPDGQGNRPPDGQGERPPDGRDERLPGPDGKHDVEKTPGPRRDRDREYRAPPFLLSHQAPTGGHLPEFEAEFRQGEYIPWLAIRPLILWPYAAWNGPLYALGIGGLLGDPLDLHLVNIKAGMGNGPSPLFNALYRNTQLPLRISLGLSNDALHGDGLTSPDRTDGNGADSLQFLEQTLRGTLQFSMGLPWDLPEPHSFQYGAGARFQRILGALYREEKADRWEALAEKAGPWRFWTTVFAGYSAFVPSAFALVHPLHWTYASAELDLSPSGGGRALSAAAGHTRPLFASVAYTLRYAANYRELPSRPWRFDLPDYRDALRPSFRRHAGHGQAWGAALAFPLRRGFMAELPVLGPWNYMGAELFTGYAEEDFRKGGGPYREQWHVGARLVNLVHVLRRVPAGLAVGARYAYPEEEGEFRLSLDVLPVLDALGLGTSSLSGRHRPGSAF